MNPLINNEYNLVQEILTNIELCRDQPTERITKKIEEKVNELIKMNPWLKTDKSLMDMYIARLSSAREREMPCKNFSRFIESTLKIQVNPQQEKLVKEKEILTPAFDKILMEVQASPKDALRLIEKHHITDEPQWVAIAKIVASFHEPYDLILQKLLINSKIEDRFVVAKIAAAHQNPRHYSILNYIKIFSIRHIDDLATLLSIVLLNFSKHSLGKGHYAYAISQFETVTCTEKLSNSSDLSSMTSSVSKVKDLAPLLKCFYWLCRAFRLSDIERAKYLLCVQQLLIFEDTHTQYLLLTALFRSLPQEINILDKDLFYHLAILPFTKNLALTLDQQSSISHKIQSLDTKNKELALKTLYRLGEYNDLDFKDRIALLNFIFGSMRDPISQVQEKERAQTAQIPNMLKFTILNTFFDTQTSKDMFFTGENLRPLNQEIIFHIMLTAIKSFPERTHEILMDFLENKLLTPYFRSVYEFIMKNNAADSIGLSYLLSCFQYYAWHCVNLKPLKHDLAKHLPFIHQLIGFKNPTFRASLLEIFLEYPTPFSEGIPKHALLFHILLAPLLKTCDLDIDQSKKMFAKLEDTEFADSMKKEVVIKSLYRLINCKKLSAKNKGELLRHIFNLDEKTQSAQQMKENPTLKRSDITHSLQTLDAIIFSGCALELLQTKDIAINGDKSLIQPINLSAILNKVLTAFLGIKEIEQFDKKYQETIAKAREPASSMLLIYARKLDSLPEHEKEDAINTLCNFTTVVLEGKAKYQEWRYQTNNYHLATVFASMPGLQKEWQSGAEKTFTKLLQPYVEASGSQMTVPKIKSQLHEFSVHIKQADPELLSLNEYLKSPTNDIAVAQLKVLKDVIVKSKNELGKFSSRIGKEKEEASQLKSNAQMEIMVKKLEFQYIFIKLLNSKQDKSLGTIESELGSLSELINKLYQGNKIAREIEDLKSLIQKDKQLNKALISYAKATVVDTDDWADLLLCGTEVMNSCQSITEGGPSNQCLLGYLADGKHRMIAVKNEGGQILGRCIMRLLWDDKFKRAVIFQEKFYLTSGAPPQIEEAINEMFKERAKALGLCLVRSKKNETAVDYPNNLKSLDNRLSLFEYVDAGTDIGVKKGAYTIDATSIEVVYGAI